MTFRDILERLLDLSYEFESNSDQQREHVLSWEKYNWCFVAILAHEQALRERIDDLESLIVRSSPVHWAIGVDLEGACSWEKEAFKAIGGKP